MKKREINWSKYITYNKDKYDVIKQTQKGKKIFAMGLMPVRGPRGFRKLDYEFAEKYLNPKNVMENLDKCHFNVLGLVIKDTDGACLWGTQRGWNPTGRDLLGEFCDLTNDYNIKIMVSFTSMNDAYQGHIHPNRVSIHGRNGKKGGKPYRRGDISTHEEGEMRVELPSDFTYEQYKVKVPFLTNNFDEKIGKSRGSRGEGLIPLTSFMCPNSEHVNYLLELTEEVVKNYKIMGFFADYIRYDGAYTDLCLCNRCIERFYIQYGEKAKLLTSKEWYDFKADTIAAYALKLHNTIKRFNKNCVSGWFCLPGPRNLFTRKRLGQDWSKLSSIFDISSPMEYPYLMGTRDDGWYWGKVGDFFYWYFSRNMKKRIHEFKSPILAVTNSVECNSNEMLKQIKGFDFGLGIAVFKYFGTSESQWETLKKYAETNLAQIR
ncbi:MAG: hypothetical protein ACFFKA_01175 [Candidatus Thorarchaeota archaeon]